MLASGAKLPRKYSFTNTFWRVKERGNNEKNEFKETIMGLWQSYFIKAFELIILSESLSSDSSGQLDVSGHDGDSASVDGTEVGILEESNEVGFSSLLEGKDSTALEAELLLEVVSDLSDESLEGELADEELCGFLVFADLSKGDGSWAEFVGLLNSTGGGGTLSGCLSGEVLSGGFSSGWFSCGLLSSGHLFLKIIYFKSLRRL